MLYPFFVFAVGLVVVTFGADFLVKGASRIAAALGIPPLIIGLTVVAFGTSAPEMAVSIEAALGGQADIAMGNVVGSNIFNVLFILGLCALAAPLTVASQLIRIDVPIMIATSVLCFVFAFDGLVTRWEGLAFVFGLLGYILLLLKLARDAKHERKIEVPEEAQGAPGKGLPFYAWQGGVTIFGLVLLVGGARALVSSAITIATMFGVSELVIGLTIVAAGTSLPEVATSLVATIKGQRDIAIGNVVGSNIFNIFSVLGISAAVAPTGIAVSDQVLTVDLPVMIGVALVCLPMFFTGKSISRWEGFALFGAYCAYTTYLVLHAQKSPHVGGYTEILVWYALPASAVVLLGFFWVDLLKSRRLASAQ